MDAAIAAAANATYGGTVGHLVTITDEAENDFVSVAFPSGILWLVSDFGFVGVRRCVTR